MRWVFIEEEWVGSRMFEFDYKILAGLVNNFPQGKFYCTSFEIIPDCSQWMSKKKCSSRTRIVFFLLFNVGYLFIVFSCIFNSKTILFSLPLYSFVSL